MNIALDVNAINQVIDALADRPYRQVAGLITDITMQANAIAQAEQKEAAEQAAKAKAKTEADELAKLRAAAAAQSEPSPTPLVEHPAADVTPQ